MTRLSVNLNKVALLRNARGGNVPDLLQIARDCEAFGAQGITVHPRPDERHIRYSDVPALKQIVSTEYNIEGNPTEDFLQLVESVRPDQCTLVPDDPNQLTSDHGWDTIKHADFLKKTISRLQSQGIRVAIFLDPEEAMVEGAKAVGTDRIELYTGPFAHDFHNDPESAVAPYTKAAELANKLGLGINAGHDLDLDNLRFFKEHIPGLLEVSIGHALIADALYYGLKNTVQMYLSRL
ncbi:MAG: pyridoxine 5'-phosphate synthase [Saprospiraceae bacterium]|nr:pyridoxine 5'-phosphate synthase [Saprospiraceae bacterium]